MTGVQTCALPICGSWLAGAAGFEPAHSGVKVRCLTTWLYPYGAPHRPDVPDGCQVSIHAPHARGDEKGTRSVGTPGGFNPRPSCEGRPDAHGEQIEAVRFQSTPLMRGATRKRPWRGGRGGVSIHAPHARGDHWLSDNRAA